MTRDDESKQPGKASRASAGDASPGSAAITQFRAPAVGEAVDGTLDPADCPDGAHVVTGNDIRTGVGDSVTLTWRGITVDGQAAAPYTQTKTIASSEVNKPVKFDPVPLARITALAGGAVGVSYTVTTSGGTKTGASLVNALQVQKQDKPQVPTQFYAPAVTEANGDGTLDPADCPDGAHVVTGNDIETGVGDSVTLTWQGITVDGQAEAPYTQTKTIASSEVNKPVKFDPVPLAQITALAGGTVDVSYIVTTSGGTKTGASLVNALQVRKQDKPQVPTQFYAPAVTEANGDGTLDPADCPDGAHVVTGNDIRTSVGDSVTLTWRGITVDGQAAAPYTQTKTIASSEVNKPVKFDPVPLARITALAGGAVGVSYTVTTSGGTKTGASLVNALQVQKQDKPQVPTQFYAPAVTEANGDGTLDPADCPDGAHVVTGNDIETGVGDSVTLTWQGITVDGQAEAPYTQTKTIASSEVNKPVKFDPVPLAQITALAGGTVDVSYIVTTSGGTKTGASLVNALQVRKQDKPQVPTQFYAPAVTEANGDGTLDPADCPDGAHVVTGNDIRTSVGDEVTVIWQGTTAYGQAAAPYTQAKTIASSEVNKPVKFDPVPLAQITALAGGTVDVSYIVTASGGAKRGFSLVNTLHVRKQDKPQVPTQFYAPAVTEANGDGTLDPADCPDGAHIVTGNDIETGVGDSVTLTWRGITVDGQAAAPYTQTKTIASSEVNKPVKFDPVPLARITALAGGAVGVSYTVTTSGGTKTGASLVNALQVQKQDKPQVPTQFYAPAVTEANGDGTLDPADCPDGAHVVTGNDIETGVGDSVTLTWQGITVDGQAEAPYTQAKTIASSEVNKPVKFDPVPLARITALAGGTVDVSYVVTASGGAKRGFSLVNTLQVRKQDKPQATFKVRGCRGTKMAIIASGSLVAVDGVVGFPVTAQWQYEGDSRSVIAERLVDMHPEKILTVTANGVVVRLAPVSIASALGPVMDKAVAVRLDDGTIASWFYNGKDPNNYLPDELATVNDVVAIFATEGAFAALRRDGSVVAWGGPYNGGNVPPDIAALRDIVSISATKQAFTALRSDGSVVAWGDPNRGGQVPPDITRLHDIVSVFATSEAFAALRRDGSVVAWGEPGYGSNVPPEIARLNNIVSITGSFSVFVALRRDGSVVAWGEPGAGGYVPSEIARLNNIVSTTASGGTFAALRGDGSVIVWGEPDGGGNVPSEIAALRDIVSVAGAYGACAALRRDGSVMAWGLTDAGGGVPADIARLTDIVCVCASMDGFAAIRSDGSVWAWPDPSSSYGSYMTHSSSTLAVYPFFANDDFDQGFLCLDEDHRLSMLGNDDKIPEEIQGRVTWTL